MPLLEQFSAWRARAIGWAQRGRRAWPGRPAAASSAEPVAPEAGVPGVQETTRFGVRALMLGMIGFVGWAALAPLDEGVPTQGTVSLETKRKAVQHLTGGIVRAVHVGEGAVVQAGQLLIKLDDTAVYAGYQSTRQHYLTLRATESRLMAEQLGETTIAFHPDVLAAADDPWVRQLEDNQRQLLLARRGALTAELTALRQSLAGQQGTLVGLMGVLPHRQQQLILLQEELGGLRDLVAEGYAPANQQRALERQAAELAATLSDLQGTASRTRSAVAELQARVLQREQEYRKEIGSTLADLRREVQADADKLRAAEAELARTEIRAPAGGQVVGLVMQTVGGVIQPSQKLMDIVPADEGLILEARVPPHLVDRVHAGQETDIRFANFVHAPQLVVPGQVISISGDLLSEPGPGGQPLAYYLARIAVTPAGRQRLGPHVLQAGMPAEVLIRTGERSLLTYLLHPLVKRLAAAMKEA